MIKEIRLNKSVPELDLNIFKIEYPTDEQPYFIVTFSLYESLGEQGEYYTEFYDAFPTEEELIKDIKEFLRSEREELRNKILSYREERYLTILEGLNLNTNIHKCINTNIYNCINVGYKNI